MAVESLHENRGILGPEILGRHRVISTLMEELQAIDWYNQRIQAATIRSSRRSRLLERLRRHDACFDQYLFADGPIR
jgi:uncharacterized protein